jgi:hypothetical protein
VEQALSNHVPPPPILFLCLRQIVSQVSTLGKLYAAGCAAKDPSEQERHIQASLRFLEELEQETTECLQRMKPGSELSEAAKRVRACCQALNQPDPLESLECQLADLERAGARLDAALAVAPTKRPSPDDDGKAWQFEPGECWYRGKRFKLRGQKWDLLLAFAGSKNQTLTRGEIIQHIRDGTEVDEDRINGLVSDLRSVLRTKLGLTKDDDPIQWLDCGVWQLTPS